MTAARPRTSSGMLAINRLKSAKPLDAEAVDRFLGRHEVPVVEGEKCTFLWRGEADEAWVCQRIVGLPDRIPLRRLHGSDLWYLVLELPKGSRVEYQIELRRGEHYERFNDPLNEKRSHSPMGSMSLAFGAGYETPDWVLPDPDARPGELRELVLRSKALGRDAHVTLYLPARFRRTASYPLLVVHDGGDFLQYASMKTVLDNLIHRLDVAETVVAFTTRGTGWSSTRTRRRTPGSSRRNCCRNWSRRSRSSGRAPGGACWARRSVGSPRCRRPTGRPTRTAPWC